MPTARRPYRSDVRTSRAQESRRVIVAAATRLFVERGYAATTIDAVAAAAEVYRKTVFASVGGKATLLKLAWDWTLVGDDELLSMAERPAVAAILAATEPHAAVELWVDMLLEASGRAAPLGRVVELAADSDPDAAELWGAILRERHAGTMAFTDHLASRGWLRDDLPQNRAADLCWVYSDPVVYRRLVLEREWTPGQLGAWLKASVAVAILRTEPSPG